MGSLVECLAIHLYIYIYSIYIYIEYDRITCSSTKFNARVIFIGSDHVSSRKLGDSPTKIRFNGFMDSWIK